MRILLTNLWSDDNKGDVAITQGLVRAIRGNSPAATIMGVSCFGARQDLARHHRHIEPDLDRPVIAALWSPYPENLPGDARRRVRGMADFFLALLVPGLARRLSPRARPLLAAIGEADLIVAKGGQYLHSSSRSFRDQLSFVRQAQVLLLALRLRRPIALAGHSFLEPHGSITALVLTTLLRRAELVWVREEISLELARRLAPTSNTVLAGDSAFLLEAPVSQKGRHPKLVAIVPRLLPATGATDHLQAIADAARSLIAEGYCVQIIAQGLGPSRSEDDRTAADHLHQLLRDQGDEIRVINQDLTPSDLVALYGSSEVVLAVRLHAAILAMVAATPAVGLSYYGPKTDGILSDMGRPELVLDAVTADAEAIASAVRWAVAREAEEPGGLARSVIELRDSALRVVHQMIDRRAR